MKPTAYSQVFEQLFRVSIIVVVAFLISRNFFDTYALGVWSVYATLFSGVIGTIVLYIFKIKKPKEIFEQVKSKVPWRYFIKVLFLFGIIAARSEENTSELQSRGHLVCFLLFVYKKLIS